MWIKVKRAYLNKGDRVDVGTVLEVSDAFGRELITADKAERMEPEQSAGPMTTESSAALVPNADSGVPDNTQKPAGEPAKADKEKTTAGKEKSNAGK